MSGSVSINVDAHVASTACCLRRAAREALLTLTSVADATRNVIEFAGGAWESPPGLAVCPLDVIFMICAAVHSWLGCNDDHIAVRARHLLGL